jgi:hypothetical protein
MVKEIHRPFWTSLFTVPDQGNLFITLAMDVMEICLDEHAIDNLAEHLEKTVTIQN